jgi:hypothetical protein
MLTSRRVLERQAGERVGGPVNTLIEESLVAQLGSSARPRRGRCGRRPSIVAVGLPMNPYPAGGGTTTSEHACYLTADPLCQDQAVRLAARDLSGSSPHESGGQPGLLWSTSAPFMRFRWI